MKIFEVTEPINNLQRDLLGVAEFLRTQNKDFAADGSIDFEAFKNLASDMFGVEVSINQLEQMSGQPPLNTVIQTVDIPKGQIFFAGSQELPDTMSVPQAQEVVSRAANRAAKKRS